MKLKVVGTVIDSGKNIVATINIFENIFNIPCTAHRLNLAVHDSFELAHVYTGDDEPSDAIELEQYLYNSINVLLAKCRKFVGSFRHSALLTQQLSAKQLQLECPKLKLVQEVKTRWNSLFDSCNSLIINQRPLTSVMAECKNEKIKTNFPTDYEFQLLNEFCDIFRPLKEITVSLSGSKYCTASIVFPTLYCLVRERLSNIQLKYSETINLKDKLCLAIEKRFEHVLVDGKNGFWLGLCLLDWRFKSFYFVDDSDERKKLIKTGMKFLVEYYMKNVAQSPVTTTSTSTTTTTALRNSTNTNKQTPKSSSFLSAITTKCLIKTKELNQTEKSQARVMQDKVETEIASYVEHHDFNFIDDDNDDDDKTSPLDYFKFFNGRYPIVDCLARHLLCIPATSVPAECLFSHAGQISTFLRNRLSTDTLETLTFLKDNMLNI